MGNSLRRHMWESREAGWSIYNRQADLVVFCWRSTLNTISHQV